MDPQLVATLVLSNIIQGVPGLLAVLAVPSVTSYVIQFVVLGRSNPEQRLPLMLPVVPGALLWWLLILGAVLACVFQRRDPLRHAFAGAVCVGVLLRETMLLVVLLGNSLTLFGR